MAEIIKFSDTVLAYELLKVNVWQNTPQDSHLEIGEIGQVILTGSHLRRSFNWKVAIDCLYEERQDISQLDEHEYNKSRTRWISLYNRIHTGYDKSHKIAKRKNDPDDYHIDKLCL